MNTMPRPEHPLPQWERSTWKNLNGEWDFSFDFGKSGVDRCFYEKKDWEKKIIVPFCPESDLSGIGYKDYMDAVWYHKTVELTEEMCIRDRSSGSPSTVPMNTLSYPRAFIWFCIWL